MKASTDPEFHLLTYIRSDWRANGRNPRGLTIATMYRIAHYAILRWKVTPIHTLLWGSYLVFYKFFTEFILGCEIQAGAVIGKSLIIDHGFSVVINKHSVIGSNCRLRHGVTIGCSVRPDGSQGRSPVVGDFVEFGSHAVAIGGISIGDHVKVAANSLVVTDIAANSKVMGVPAKLFLRPADAGESNTADRDA